GIVLPTMHQSSLGSLFIIAGYKVHPLWQTALLPLLFLVSCVGMGYAAVVIESALSSRLLHRKAETPMLATLGKAVAWISGLYLVLRFGDLAWNGKLGLVFGSGGYSLLFWIEIALFAAP